MISKKKPSQPSNRPAAGSANQRLAEQRRLALAQHYRAKYLPDRRGRH